MSSSRQRLHLLELEPRHAPAGIRFAEAIASGSGSLYPFHSRAADLNNDGFVDLVVPHRDGQSISILLGDGTGALTTVQTIHFPPKFGGPPTFPLSFPFDVALGDITGDGHIDMVVAGGFNAEVRFFAGNGTGQFTEFGTPLVLGSAADPTLVSSLVLGNFDGSGPDDLAIYITKSDRALISIYRGLGGGAFEHLSTTQTSPLPPTFTNYYLTAVDFNNDGVLDLLAPNYALDAVTLLTNDGTGHFSVFNLFTVNAPVTVATGDFNGDGHVDFAVTGYEGGTVGLFAGNGTGTFTAMTSLSLPPVYGPYGLAVADFDADGRLDLIVSHYGQGNGILMIYRGQGDGSFVTEGSPILVGPATGLVTADFNNDGRPDLAVTLFTNQPNNLLVLLNDSGPRALDMALSSSANPSTFGDAVTFSATLAGSDGPVTGTVDFFIDGQYIGTGIIIAGVASLVYQGPLLNAGSHNVTAIYSGHAIYESTNAQLLQTVVPAPTTTTVSSSLNPSQPGQAVTFTATVTSPNGMPTGTVEFFINGQSVGVVALVNGVAVLTTDQLPLGEDAILAVYSGDGNFLPSQDALPTQVVSPVASTVEISSSLNPSTFGQPVTFIATVTGAGGTPTGTVQFFINGQAYGDPVTLAKGIAGITVLDLPAGLHTIEAVYSGDGTYEPGSASLVQTVNPLATVTTLNGPTTPTMPGQQVTLTATVTTADPSVGSPPGRVDFFANGVFLGSAIVVDGVATLTTTALPVGLSSITATFVPSSSSFLGSQDQGGHEVRPLSGNENPPITPPGPNPTPGGQTPSPTAPAPIRRYAIGAGPGGGPHVRVIDPLTGAEIFSFYAYDPSFRGGVTVATADVNGDGVDDIITGAGPGGGPHVIVWDGVTGQVIMSFFAYLESFTGGVHVAAADVNGDGFADIITGAGHGGGPHVQVFSGKDGSLIHSFFAYLEIFVGGVTVAAADINGDGFADIITGAGPYGGPHVHVFDGITLATLKSFYAFAPNFLGGVWVAGDLAADGTFLLSVGAGFGGPPIMHLFRGPDLLHTDTYQPYPTPLVGGVRTGIVTMNGQTFLVMGAGPGGGPHIKVHDGDSLDEQASYFGYSIPFHGRAQDLGLMVPFTPIADNPYIDMLGGVFVG